MTPLEFSDEELLDLADAVDTAGKRVENEMTLKRSAPYTRALQAQHKRYTSMHGRVLEAIEKAS